MTEEAFEAAIRELPNLSEDQKSRLLSTVAKLDAQWRAQILNELQENERRENKILDEGLIAITSIERTIDNHIRTNKEEADRKNEQSHLPNFDSILTTL